MRTLMRAIVIATSVAIALPGMALAAVPPNDTFDNATAIAALPFSEAFDLTDATDDPSTPPCEAAEHHRIWYRYTAPADEVVHVSEGGQYGAELALWTVDPVTSALTLASCATTGYDLVAHLTGGTMYAFSVGQWETLEPWASGTVRFEAVPAPPNDAFADAAPIADGQTVIVQRATIVAATREPGEPVASCEQDPGAPTATMWYRFSLAQPTQATVFTQLGASAAIYSGLALDSLTERACTRDEGASVALPAGDYWIQLGGRPFRPEGMSLTLDLLLPPANDRFADAITIASAPFSGTVDLTGASREPGEPDSCSNGYAGTAWWSYTAPSDGRLTIYAYGLPVAAFTGSDVGALAQLACATYTQAFAQVHRGDVIHVQLAGPQQANPASLSVDFAPSPTNDDVAHATATGDIPFDIEVNTAAASFEAGEPTPSCYGQRLSTVWYRAVATGHSMSFRFEPDYRQMAVAAYTGSGVEGLSEIGCASPWVNSVFTIDPPAGTAIWLQVGASDWESDPRLTLHGFATPDPTVDFAPGIGAPSVYSDIPFYDQTTDPGGATHTSSWTFGDGTSSTDSYPVHRYAADGDYPVTLSVVTSDGRTGSATKTVHVQTHDVSILGVDVPPTVRAGQKVPIKVRIYDRRYPESGSVQLWILRAGGYWHPLDQKNGVRLRAMAGRGTTDVAFSYVVTADDASPGKITFRAIVSLDGVDDADSADNELTTPPVFVEGHR